MAKAPYSSSVFINCPFDASFQPLFDALVFAIIDCGFTPRCALEVDDGSEVRIDKIFNIIAASRYGIHDISRTEIDTASGLPRFNMPLELGFFLSAKRFGEGTQKKKSCLVLDKDRFRYQQFLSDIAGQDIRSHQDSPRALVRIVRDWLATKSQRRSLPSGGVIWDRYSQFQSDLPPVCEQLKLRMDELTYLDRLNVTYEWLKLST
jgi:hypothetical protein